MLLSNVLLNTKQMSLILPLAVPGKIQSNASWVGNITLTPVSLRAESVSIVYFHLKVYVTLL